MQTTQNDGAAAKRRAMTPGGVLQVCQAEVQDLNPETNRGGEGGRSRPLQRGLLKYQGNHHPPGLQRGELM